jgi:hypothetical protein
VCHASPFTPFRSPASGTDIREHGRACHPRSDRVRMPRHVDAYDVDGRHGGDWDDPDGAGASDGCVTPHWASRTHFISHVCASVHRITIGASASSTRHAAVRALQRNACRVPHGGTHDGRLSDDDDECCGPAGGRCSRSGIDTSDGGREHATPSTRSPRAETVAPDLSA